MELIKVIAWIAFGMAVMQLWVHFSLKEYQQRCKGDDYEGF